MALQHKNDFLSMQNNPSFMKKIANGMKHKEQILISTKLFKINRKRSKQNRVFVLTNKAIYNIKIGKIFKGLSVKRRIPIKEIAGITTSKSSGEFVIHVPKEYDYRYNSPDKKEIIFEMIGLAFSAHTKAKCKFWFVDKSSLESFQTNKEHMKNQEFLMPVHLSYSMMNHIDFQVSQFHYFPFTNQKKKQRSELKIDLYESTPEFEEPSKLSIDDFTLFKVLGRGAFGKVMLVQKKDNKKFFALKSLRKDDLIDKEQIYHTKLERDILEKVHYLSLPLINNSKQCRKHPFLVGLEHCFQDKEKIFFVMQFMKGGELFQHLRQKRRFSEKRTKFYAACIILGIEFLHSKHIVYRDLKPENVLMDESGFISLADFGMSKLLTKKSKKVSLCGTPEYIAPEVLHSKGHQFVSDWWSLGILIYEMYFGRPPFYDENQTTMFQNIMDMELVFKKDYIDISEDQQDFIRQLLEKKPKQRIGYEYGAIELKKHRWFKGFNWEELYDKRMEPPFIPEDSKLEDFEYFDEGFTSEQPVNSHIPAYRLQIISDFQDEFEGMTYSPEKSMG